MAAFAPDDPHRAAPTRDAPLGRTRRERLRDLLLEADEGVSLEEIEQRLHMTRSAAVADLEHLRRSFRHRPTRLLVVPPSCTTCGYTFRLERVRAPSKCPACHGHDLADPVFKAEA